MASLFQPDEQHRDVRAKVVVALERLSTLMRQLLWNEAKAHGLSPLQVQFLVFLYYHASPLRRVSHLAREFQVTQATVSDAVRALEEKGLLVKTPWPEDRRVMTLQLTERGQALAEHLAHWADPLYAQLAHLSPENQETLMWSLMQLIAHLQQSGLISVARMCLTCRFLEAQGETAFFCRFLDQPLSLQELRLDCPEQEPRTAT